MDNQEIFNIVWKGLEAQGFRRSMDNGKCRYRGEDGSKCAIGFLIPDEDYSPSFETLSVYDLIEQGILAGANSALLNRLQCAHDVGYDPEMMKENLLDVADQYMLEVPHA